MVMIDSGHEKKAPGIISVTQVTYRSSSAEGRHASRPRIGASIKARAPDNREFGSTRELARLIFRYSRLASWRQ